MLLRNVRDRPGALRLRDLLVIIGIVVVAIGLLLPAIQQVRAIAAREQCENNMRKLGYAAVLFSDVQGHLPPTMHWFDPTKPNVGAYGSTFFHLLPYLGNRREFESTGTLGPAGQGVYLPWLGEGQAPIRRCICPADPTYLENQYPALGSYVASYQAFRGFVGNDDKTVSIIPSSFRDGCSNTVIFAERLAQCGSFATHELTWLADESTPMFAYYVTGPVEPTFVQAYRAEQCSYERPATPHSGVMMIGMADGSCQPLSVEVSPIYWWGIITPNGGEVFQGDW
jgi:hypothetical protein